MTRRLLGAGVLTMLTLAALLPRQAGARESSPPKGVANDTKSITAGTVLVTDVIIQGNERITTEWIKDRLHTQPGNEYRAETVDEDVRSLHKTCQFTNIRTFVEKVRSCDVRIYITVCDRWNTVQKVTYSGARHIKEVDLCNCTGVRVDGALNPHFNREGCRKIEEKYADIDRPFTSCTLVKGGDPNDTEVIYQITEGPKVKVADILFAGNTFISTARLTAKMHLSSRWFHLVGGTYNKRMADSDINEVIKYFRSLGFDDVRVALETQRSADGREVTMIFHIQEGQRFRSGDDQSIHHDHCSSGNIIAVNREQTYIPTPPGAYPQPERADHKPAKTPAPSPEKKTKEQPPARVGQIFIVGNDTVSDTSILAHVPLFPGAILKYADLKEAEKNLAKLGVFVVDPAKGIQPTIKILDAGEDSPFKDIVITVKEKPQAKDPGSKP